MAKNLLRGVPSDVKEPFADASAADVEGIIDGLSADTMLALVQAVNNAFDWELTAEGFADDLGCRVEVAEKLLSLVWPAA